MLFDTIGGIIMNEQLRQKCKELKLFQDIKYKEIAEYLEITPNSFYNWIRGYYNLSEDKQR